MGSPQQPSRTGDHALREALRLLTRAQSLVTRALLARNGNSETISADDQSLLRAISEYNEAQDLARPDQPGVSADAEIHRGVPLEMIDASQDERVRRQNSFTQFELNQECFTGPQWAVICPYYRDGLNDEQIGVMLDRSGSAVYKRRRRAEKRLKARKQDLEQKRLSFASKFIKK